MGYIFLYQQQYDQALAEIKQAVTLAPTDAWSYAALAEVLSRVGRTEDVLDEAAAQVLRLKSSIADDHLGSVGTAYALAGNYEKARTSFSATSAATLTFCLTVLCWPRSTAS